MHPHARRRRAVTGHLVRYEGKRGSSWYARLQLPDGRRKNVVIGRVWRGKGRPPAGHLTRRQADAALRALIVDAGRGDLPGLGPSINVTFRDVAEQWYENGLATRGWRPATQRDYESMIRVHLLRAPFAGKRIEEITSSDIEHWRSTALASGKLGRRTAIKALMIANQIFKYARRAHGLRMNPLDDVERLRHRHDASASASNFYGVEEVHALVRAATEQDAALFLTAAFTGLRQGELLALRVRDVNFEAESINVVRSFDHRSGVGPTKGGRSRTVPMVAEVAKALAKLLSRPHFTDGDSLVFPNEVGTHLDPSALRRRYKAAQKRAGLRPLRFHDLRHTFGSLSIQQVSPIDLQAYMGHSDGRTTSIYLHRKSRANEAALLARAFAVESPTHALRTSPVRLVEEARVEEARVKEADEARA
jgi:integrase